MYEMKKLVLLSIALFFGFFILFAQQTDEKELILKKVQDKGKQLQLFFQQGEIDSIAQIFSPNCHVIPEYGEIVEGREAVTKFFSIKFKSGLKITDIKMDPVEQRVYNDIVIELGTCTVKYSTKANPAPITGKFNYLLNWKASKKENYRIRAVSWNSIQFPCK